MPFTIGTKPINPSESQDKKRKRAERKEKDKKKEALYKRRKESEALLFGSELFEPIAKKEKEIIIHFPEICTDEGIYISKCGNFGYRSSGANFYFDLFYFVIPIKEFEASLCIIPSDEIWLFDNLTPAELEDIAIRLRRAEYAEERRKALEEIRRVEKERRDELDKADEEFEAEQEKEQLRFETQMIPETNIEITTVTNDKEGITEVVSSRIVEQEPTLNEISAVEAKIKKATEEIKPKQAFIPLIFKKVEK